MADLPPAPDPDQTTPVRPDSQPAPPQTPRWVIVLGVIALILILAVAVQFVFGFQHGPGMHGAR
jgi:hypothetical protein